MSFLICKTQKTHHKVKKIIYDDMVTDRSVKLFQREKRKIFPQMLLEEQLDIHMGRRWTSATTSLHTQKFIWDGL